MNAQVLQDFSYDPFDPAVMADPLPYYQVLRDEHPVYYIDRWDTYALSRFSDIWQVLEINDGTFVASEGTLPAATVLAERNDGPVADPPLHPMPFHAIFDAPIYDAVRRCTSGPFRPKSVSTLADRIRTLANERLDELLPRGAFDLTQEYGGIVAASVVCELVGLPVDLAPDVLATVNAGSLAQPGSGVEVANARPGYLEYLVPIVQRRRANDGDELPIVDNLIDYRLPDGSAFNDIEAATQLLGVFIGGTETVPQLVAHGLWELGRRPDQLAAIRSDLEANMPVARGDDSILRPGAVVRPHRAQAVHHPRHHNRPGSANHHAARVGQPRRARIRQSRRLHVESAHRTPAGLRPGTALLPRGTSRAPRDRNHGDRMAQAG
jgi:cytochrome P450